MTEVSLPAQRAGAGTQILYPPPGFEYQVLTPPGRTLVKYVFVQDDPFYLTKVLDKYLREFSDSTAGICLQPPQQGRRTVVETAVSFLRMYGPRYFLWKAGRYLLANLKAKIVNDLLRLKRACYTVEEVAKKYDVPVHRVDDVNADDYRKLLRDLGVEFIISISGTQMYRRALREQTPYGIVNCHGALLPRYRGLMPSFWTLANAEKDGGVSVHYVDSKLDNGPIVVQKRYRIHPHDTLEEIMARSKDLAAEAIIECVRLVEAGHPPLMPNPEAEMTHYSMPTAEDVRRFRSHGHRFY